jgi:hypothetical protein
VVHGIDGSDRSDRTPSDHEKGTPGVYTGEKSVNF